MAVRVKIKIKIKDKDIETSAVANAGYESDEPEVIIPEKLADEFNLLEKTPPVAIYETVSGPFEVYRIENLGVIEVLTDDKYSKVINCHVIIVSHEREVILSDKLIEELNIILLQPSKGRWKFIDDPPDKIRDSVVPTYW